MSDDAVLNRYGLTIASFHGMRTRAGLKLECHSRGNPIHRQLFRAADIHMSIGDRRNRELDCVARSVARAGLTAVVELHAEVVRAIGMRSEERRVGKEC